jgi:hypothetical protein
MFPVRPTARAFIMNVQAIDGGTRAHLRRGEPMR